MSPGLRHAREKKLVYSDCNIAAVQPQTHTHTLSGPLSGLMTTVCVTTHTNIPCQHALLGL
jgi:hypothetical protein